MIMRTLDLTEAAEFLHLHPHTLEAKARAGEVPGAKPGKCWVFLTSVATSLPNRKGPGICSQSGLYESGQRRI